MNQKEGKRLTIFDSAWWTNKNIGQSQRFSLVTVADIKAGIWSARNPGFPQKALAYVRKISLKKRFCVS